MNTPQASIHQIGAKRAVIYLRVSTTAQAKTSRDDEGFSIAAQREACLRKAEALGAEVIDQYVDAGESARSADRPNLNAMLHRLKTERDIDYVIVHKVDRLARNRSDDVGINMVIRTAGAQLVSVSENIDETPSGMLLHGIMSSIAEFYSQNLATEIVKGMSQKAKQGGHPYKAPVGYLNVRAVNDGHEFRTIDLDPERAENVTWAFSAYASGDYSLAQLTDALLDRGLTTKPTPKFPARPLTVKHVHNMLRNRFYVGLVKWHEAEYPGEHTPLVSIETFARVQALLQSRGAASEKTRAHPHYLKGSIFCGRCGGRLCFTRSSGRGGSYDYFFCLNRHQQRRDCDLPFLPVGLVEEAVAAHYGTIQPTQGVAAKLASALSAETKVRTAGADAESRRQRKRITDLEATRRKLLQAHLADAIPVELLKEEQDRISRELANAGAALAATEIDWEALQLRIDAAIGFTTRLEDAYRHADGKTRRHLNQTIFEELRIDRGGVTYARLTDPMAQLFAEDLLADLRQEREHPGPVEQDQGVKVHHLVELRGIEPLTSSMPWKRSTN